MCMYEYMSMMYSVNSAFAKHEHLNLNADNLVYITYGHEYEIHEM